MSAGHTPGPWRVRYTRAGYPCQIEAPSGNKGPGGITSVTRAGAISLPSSDEGRANARLIVAAPDLLEALQAVQQVMHDGILNSDGADVARAIKLMNAAIAKATGK